MANNEKNTFNPEVIKGHEALNEVKEVGAEQREKLRKNREHVGEESHENADKALHEALENSTSKEALEEKHETAERAPSPAERRNGPRATKELDASFTATITEAQSQMSAPSRTFSKVIHNKAVERVSEVTGSTIARPDAILSGAIVAFLMTLGVYLVAKNLGYPLSGFETIGAFALGWILGLAFDFLRVMVTGRK